MDRRDFLKGLILSSVFITTQNHYSFLAGKDKKDIILTIDDGPRKTMNVVLEDLGSNKENPAVFYIVGKNLKSVSTRDLAKKALINGHVLGNHSYNHPDFLKINFETAKGEIEKTEEPIEEIHQEVKITKTKKLFRFPYGHETEKIREYLKEQGYAVQRWNIDSNDWRYYSKNNPLSLTSIILNCENAKEKDIVLVHDIPITAKYLIPFFLLILVNIN